MRQSARANNGSSPLCAFWAPSLHATITISALTTAIPPETTARSVVSGLWRHEFRRNSKVVRSVQDTLAVKLWRMTWPERGFILEAAILLAIARTVTLFVPFRDIARLASRPVRRAAPSAGRRNALVESVRSAVSRCARKVPWRALCFEQGFAAQAMLRRRGIDAVMYYGAATNGTDELSAHVWVRDGDNDVIGCENAAQYAVLATFPARATCRPV